MAIPQRNWQQGQAFFREIPVTKVIILIWVATFLAGLIAPGVLRLLAFVPGAVPNGITGLLTYPLVGAGGPIGLLFNGLMLYWFGGSLERSWGARTYLLLLAGVSVAAALVWELGIFLFTGSLTVMATPLLLVSGVVVAWAFTFSEETIMFWFVLPLKAKWVGWLDIALLYLMFPLAIPVSLPNRLVLGFFALGGVAAAWGYVWYRRQWGWIPRRPREKQAARRTLRHPASHPMAAVLRPWQDWQRRRRIAHLQRTIRFEDEEHRR